MNYDWVVSEKNSLIFFVVVDFRHKQILRLFLIPKISTGQVLKYSRLSIETRENTTNKLTLTKRLRFDSNVHRAMMLSETKWK